MDIKFWARSRTENRMIFTNSTDSKHELDLFFFNADVLSKYRSKPSQYSIDSGCIKTNFENSDENWILQSCYPCDDGTIYCYLYDLSLLPEKEQRYWQSFNLDKSTLKENPLAVERDFKCSFQNSQKQNFFEAILEINDVRVGADKLKLWQSKEDLKQMCNEIMLPLIEENKHYRDEFLLPLARLVIEGFLKENLQKWTTELKVTFDKDKDGSLKLLENILSNLTNSEKAKIFLKPLRDLHTEKSSRSSHGGKTIEILMVQKSTDILTNVTNSLISIVQIIKSKS